MYRQICRITPILPDAFWRLTPFEAGCIMQGGLFRDDREWERAAFVTAHLMNVSGKSLKQDITPHQLLGRSATVTPKDPGAKAEALRARAERMDTEHGG